MAKGIIDNFNDSVQMTEVYERITGMKIGKTGNCKCPFHVSNSNTNAGIDLKRNSFSCFSHECAKGMKAYEFIMKYNNLENEKFPIIAKKINEYYPNSFRIYSKNELKKDCKLADFYIKIEKDFRNKIEERINLLNEFFFNKQGINPNLIKMQQLWDYVKLNEFYESIADYIQIDKDIVSFKIDEERLIRELINRTVIFRNKFDKGKYDIKYIIDKGKKLSDRYKLNPNQELEEKLKKYRLEYKLLKAKIIKIEKERLSKSERLRVSVKSGLEYLEIRDIEEILENNNLDNINRQICEMISQKEENIFICGNLDYTISMLYIKPFNYNDKLIEEKYMKYIDDRLKCSRKQIGSKFNDRYFCDKEIKFNKKLKEIFLKTKKNLQV